MAADERERHVTAVRAAHHPDPVDVEPGVGAELLDPGDVVEPVLTAPVAVDVLGVGQAVAGGAPTLTNTANPRRVRNWIIGIENQVKSGRSWLWGPPWT